MLLLLAYLLKGQESILETSVNEPPVVCMLANWKWTMRGSREIIQQPPEGLKALQPVTSTIMET